MFFVAVRKQMSTVRHRNVIIVIVILRMGRGVKRGIARIADRPRRQALYSISVIRTIYFFIRFGQHFLVFAKRINQRRVNLQIWEIRIGQTVINDARDARKFVIGLSFAFQQGRNGYDFVLGTSEFGRTFLNRLIIFGLKVIEHFIQGHFCVIGIKFIGIREQIPF